MTAKEKSSYLMLNDKPDYVINNHIGTEELILVSREQFGITQYEVDMDIYEETNLKNEEIPQL